VFESVVDFVHVDLVEVLLEVDLTELELVAEVLAADVE